MLHIRLYYILPYLRSAKLPITLFLNIHDMLQPIANLGCTLNREKLFRLCWENFLKIIFCFFKFFHSLRTSVCHEVQVMSRYLERDIQSVNEKNLLYIQEATGLSPWTASKGAVTDALVAGEVVGVPPQDRWRLPYLCSLLRQRREAYQLALEDEESRLTTLFDSLEAN